MKTKSDIISIEFPGIGKNRIRKISMRSKEGRGLLKELSKRLWSKVMELKRPALLALLHEQTLFLLAVSELFKRKKLPEDDVRAFYKKLRSDRDPLRKHMGKILKWCWHHEAKAVKFDRLKAKA